MDVSLRPAAFLKYLYAEVKQVNQRLWPDALPPKVLSLAPAPLTLLMSHCGILPAYSIAITHGTLKPNQSCCH